MAEDVGSLVVRVAMDNSGFQQGVQNLNRSMKVIQSEFKNATAGLKEHGKGLDGLKVKQDMLGKSIDVQSKIIQQYKEKLKESKDTLNKNADAQTRLKEKVEASKNAYEQSKKVLGSNAEETKKLKADYENLSKEYTNNEEKLRNNVRTIDNWTTKTNNAEAKLKSMESELSKTSKEIDKQNNSWNKLSVKLDSIGKKFETAGKKMASIGKDMSTKISAPIATLGVASAKAAIDFESAFAGVKKTVNGTKEQFANLEKGITDMSKKLPTSASDIAHVAESAGQLGIQTDNILGFTKTIIDLGNATNLVGEEGASELAKFANITSMSQKDFDRLGSTIVDLGNNMATTEADIVAMGMRLAGAGKQVGMSEAKIMGLSAALSSVGIEAEAGGSAVSKVLVEMQLAVEKGGKGLDNFAKVAGMSSKNFQKAFKQDAAGALIEFIKGLQNSQSKGKSAIKVLDDMGISEVRMRDALLRAAGAGDLFNKAISIGTDAWKENTALANEANQRYATTESQLKIVKNEIVDAGRTIGKNLLPTIRDIAVKISEVTKKFSELSPATQQNIIKFAALVAAIGPAVWIGGKLVKGIGGAITAFSTVSGAIAVTTTGAVAATPAIGTLATVFTALNGPVGIAIAAIAGIGLITHEVSTRLKQEVVPSVDLFADKVDKSSAKIKTVNGKMQKTVGETTIKISQETKKAVGSYMELDKNASKALLDISLNSTKFTDSAKKNVINNFADMSKKSTKYSKETKDKMLIDFKNLVTNTGNLTDKNKKDILTKYGEMVKGCKNLTDKQKKDTIKAFQDTLNASTGITGQQKNTLVTQYKEMGSQINAGYDKQYKERVGKLQNFFANTNALSAKEKAQVLQGEKTHNENLKACTNEYTQKIQAILDKASKEKRQLTEDEQKDINMYQENMRKNAVSSLSKNEIESKVILERIKSYGTRITAEQASEVIKNAEQQRIKSVDEANRQFIETKAAIEYERDVTGSLTAEQAERAIKAAENQRDGTVKKANEQKKEVVKKITDMNKDVGDSVDTTTGNLITYWDNFKNWWDNITFSKKTFEFDITGPAATRFGNMGNDVGNGLAKGIKQSNNKVGKAAKGLANKTKNTYKKEMDIHSPSRVMMELGNYTSEGLALGILGNMDKVEKASRLAAQTIQNITKGKLSDVKIKINANDGEIKNRVAHQLDWGANNKNEYQNYLDFISKINKEEVEKSKEYLNEDYENRVKILDDRLRILKNENSIELQTEKSRVDAQIAYYQKLQRNTKDKKSKTNYANKIASLKKYQKQVLNATKASQKTQVNSLERSKKALEEYYKDGLNLLDKREKEIKKSFKVQENVFKDLMTTYDVAIKKLSVKTGDLIKDLENQEAIVVLQGKKVEDLRNRYEDLAYTLGTTAEETVNARQEFENSRIELENMSNTINEANQKITENINKFQKTIIDALKERYSSELELQGKAINESMQALNYEKENSIEKTNQIYNAKIKAIGDVAKIEEEKLQNGKEIKRIQEIRDRLEELSIFTIDKAITQEEKIEEIYNKRIKSIQDAAGVKIKAWEDELKVLDLVEKQKDRNEQDSEELKKINRLKETMQFEHNEFNKAEMKKNLDKLVADRNKRLHKEELEDKKESIRQKIEVEKENTENEIKKIEKLKQVAKEKLKLKEELDSILKEREKRACEESIELQKQKLEEERTLEIEHNKELYEMNKSDLEQHSKKIQDFYKEKLDAANLEAEAQKLIVENNQKEIIKLIKSYDKDYETAGKTLGERLADGMKEKISPVLDVIGSIEKRISNIRTAEIESAINASKYSPISNIQNGSSISNSTTNNSNRIVNNNITFNSPKALTPSEQRRATESTLRSLAFGM